MSIQLVINGTSYNYPIDGENPNWSEATDWAEAVTTALGTLLAPGDILETTFTINNNVAVLTNINGLLFDPGTVRAANIDYAIYRTSSTNPSGQAENGTIFLVFDDSATAGSKWQLSQRSEGTNAGVSFSITDGGQVQYTSNDIGSTGYVGSIKFRARTLSK